MKRMNWKDGWHIDMFLKYYIENGVFIRGELFESSVSPYVESKNGGYDRVYNMKANKRNYENFIGSKRRNNMHRARDRPN